MILTTHIIVGAVVASKLSNPFLGLPLSLLSHYLLDMIPHDDYLIVNIKEGRWSKSFFDFAKVSLDLSLAILLVLLLSENKPAIFAGAFLAAVPDGITLLGGIFPGNKLITWHQKLHIAVNTVGDRKENKKIPFWGAVLGQAAVLAAAILFLR